MVNWTSTDSSCSEKLTGGCECGHLQALQRAVHQSFAAWPSLAQLGGKLGGCWPWGSILSNQMVRQSNSYRNHLRNPQFIDLRLFMGDAVGLRV